MASTASCGTVANTNCHFLAAATAASEELIAGDHFHFLRRSRLPIGSEFQPNFAGNSRLQRKNWVPRQVVIG